MSQQPPRKSRLQQLSEEPATRQQVSREIEARAGSGLKREYWVEHVDTPAGNISRRAAMTTLAGIVLWCLVVTAAALWRVGRTPSVEELPFGDARTVMTHVHANFSGNKEAQFQSFVPPEGFPWNFAEAYTFFWRDVDGRSQQVIILSYDDLNNLVIDYGYYTRSVNPARLPEAVARQPEIVVEIRTRPAYGGQWRGIHMSNMLLLMTADSTFADQQEMYSHFVTITAAEHRDLIPDATPRP